MTHLIRALGFVALGLGLVVLVTACSKTYDAWFVNPCNVDLRIRTYVGGVDRITDNFFVNEAEIPARSVRKVDEAFDDAAGFQWAIVVDGYDPAIGVDGREWEHSTVLIPPEVCEGRD